MPALAARCMKWPRAGKESDDHPPYQGRKMIILGIVLLIIGALLNIGILYAVGGILVVVGLVLWILGAMGRAVGGRRHYY
jgi:hypothetical protein